MTGMYRPEMDAARLPIAFLMSLFRENLSEMDLVTHTQYFYYYFTIMLIRESPSSKFFTRD